MNDFEEWIRSECFQEPPPHSLELARAAWNVQAKRIVELESERDALRFQADCPYTHMLGVACNKCGWAGQRTSNP